MRNVIHEGERRWKGNLLKEEAFAVAQGVNEKLGGAGFKHDELRGDSMQRHRQMHLVELGVDLQGIRRLGTIRSVHGLGINSTHSTHHARLFPNEPTPNHSPPFHPHSRPQNFLIS